MPLDDAKNELAALIRSDADRTKMSRFLELFDLVDQAVIAGVKRDRLLATLSKAGLDLTPGTFNNYLSRARRVRPGQPHHQPAIPPAPLKDPRSEARSLPTDRMPSQATDQPRTPVATSPVPPTSPSTTGDWLTTIRNTPHDVDAARRRWKQSEREKTAAAKAAATSSPDLSGQAAPPLQPGPAPTEN